MEENLIGKQIGNYRLIEEIAAGSFGMVYRAQHIYLSNRIVALKLLHMHLPAKERERFIQEAQFLESLQHRHILSVVDIGFDDGRPYLASTYASGGSLRERLDRRRLLPLSQVLTIVTQVGKALHYAHQQNIVHCDLKPENILFDVHGEAVLADFGIATVLSTVSVKQLADSEGTPSYMAPEQFRGQVSKESDQYALGCIAYEMVTGQRLFSAPNFVAMGYLHTTERPTPPRQINAQIPTYVENAILKALAKSRSDRHRDVAAFLAALEVPQANNVYPRPSYLVGVEGDKSFLSTGYAPSESVYGSSAHEPSTVLGSNNWAYDPSVPLDEGRDFGPPARKSSKVGRRSVVALLAGGGVLVAGTAVMFNLNSIGPLLGLSNQSPPVHTNANNATPSVHANTQATQTSRTQPTPNTQTQNKTGAVIGNTQQKANSAMTFTDPANGTPGILVRLTDSTFVAYDQACTHVGVLVNYDPATKMLVCPAHGAVFDPAKSGAVVQGPAQRPLPKIAIQVHTDGTVTTL